MSQSGHTSRTSISRYKTIALLAALALAGYIIALPSTAPTPETLVTNTPTSTLTATKTPTQTATASPTVTPGCTPGIWAEAAVYARAAYGAATATDGTYAYTFGGQGNSGTIYAESDRYDPASNSWSPIASIATGADILFHAEYGGNGKIYLMGGEQNGTLNRVYDIASNTWTAGAPLPAARYAHGHAAFAGKIYVIGGYNGATVNTVFAYDVVSDTWSTLAPLPQGEFHLACGAINGKIYCAGGALDYGNPANLYIYDIANNSWSLGSPMPVGANFPAGTVVWGKFWVIGGGNPARPEAPASFGDTRIYDPVANTWSSGPGLNEPRSFADAVTLNIAGRQMAVIVGGTTTNLFHLNSVEINDSACVISTPTNTPTATSTPTATASPVCSPLVLYDQTTDAGMGGSNSQDFEEVFDAFDDSNADDFVVPAGQTWTVNQVAVKGLYYNGLGQVQYFNVSFYHDEATLPGAVVEAGAFVEATYTNNDGVFTITLPEELVLPSGTYWVAVQARMDYMPDGQWAWLDRTTTSNSPAAWHNPGGAFNIPACINYAPRGFTCGVDPSAPDHVFQILGTGGGTGCVTPTASPTPTDTFTPTRTATSTATATVTPTGTPVHVSLPVLNASSGSTVSVPMSVSNMTGLGITSYTFQISFDPAIVQPAAPAFDQAGTLSSGMTITADTSNSGHLIVTASQTDNLSGSGTLLNLRFRFTPTGPSGASLSFQNYTDPGNVFHPAFRFNQGSPPVMTTNGFIFPPPTPTVTPSITVTPFATATATLTRTNTATPTASPSPTCPSGHFSNTAPITINDNAAGSPYPSTITVSGQSGTVTNVTAELTGLSHPWPDSIDIMLVGPGGQNTLLMSDAGGFSSITNVDLQFDDGVPRPLPDETRIFSGAYGPSNYDTTTDVFPAPAPSPGVPVAMGVFNGTNPNGAWSLYVRADSPGGFSGSISGGWTLHINTTAGCVPTPTNTATMTPTFTPTNTATPVATPTGSLFRFSSSTYVEDESQVAQITVVRTIGLSEDVVAFGTTNGTATGGSACTTGVDYISIPFLPVSFTATQSSRTVDITICADNITEPDETINLSLSAPSLGTPSTAVLTINDTATAFKNQSNIAINGGTFGVPYPSTITVSGGPTVIGSMRVTLYDFQDVQPDFDDFLLIGPGGQNIILLADSGGFSSGGPVTLNFSDTAGAVVADNGPLITGDFEPTSFGPVINFPIGAPPAPYNEPGSAIGGTGTQTLVGNFGGTNSNGVWRLFVRNQMPLPLAPTAIVGNVAGGWGLEFLGPTTTHASISGRVTTANGQGVRNAKIVVTGGSLVEPLVATTGSFGYFRFDGLATGETYVVTVNSRRYTFGVPSRVISLVENVVDADFVAEPQE